MSFIKSMPNLWLLQESTRWAEISRPQIHGYDLNCLAVSPTIPHRLYSGGDEKVIRVYDATASVIEGLKSLAGIETDASVPVERVHVAVLPDLGLSNKAADMMTSEERELLSQRGTRMVDWSDLPLEGQLVDYTLWPEVRKLFGHKYELVRLPPSPAAIMFAALSVTHAQSAQCPVRDGRVRRRRTAGVGKQGPRRVGGTHPRVGHPHVRLRRRAVRPSKHLRQPAIFAQQPVPGECRPRVTAVV
jgi:hypothetical protein